MLSNSHLFEEEVIANAEGEKRWSRATGRAISTTSSTLTQADASPQTISSVEEASNTSTSTISPTSSVGQSMTPNPVTETTVTPIKETVTEAKDPTTSTSTTSTGGTSTLQPLSSTPITINVTEHRDPTPIAMVDPVVGIGSPIVDPITQQPIGSVGGGGLFGGGAVNRSSEEEAEEETIIEKNDSNWWIWAVIGVTIVGGIVVFHKKGSKLKIPKIIK